MDWCVEHHVALVPFGGGTSVVGGLAARAGGFAGVVSLDLVRFDRLLEVDADSMTATLEPGLRGPQAEALLAEHGLTLGHFPQSFEYASIGGFAVTRSSGQSSAGYGRFDALVVGLRVATPRGELVLGSSPANAAGPDLREVVMGSEGAFGVVTAVTVRVRRVPVARSTRPGGSPTSRPGSPRCAPSPSRACCRRCCGSPTRTRPRSTWPSPPRSGAGSGGGCLVVTGYEGTPERSRPGVRRARRCSRASVVSPSARTRGGPRGGSTGPTCATRCSTSACSWRPWRR